MLSESTAAQVRELAQQVSRREGCILYDIEFTGTGKNRVLRVYIDKTDASVSIDDCTNVSRGLNLLLDVEDPIPGGAYNLEVSSPGLERPLREKWHFEAVIGEQVFVRCRKTLGQWNPEVDEATAKRRKLQGKLVSVEDGNIEVELKQQKLVIPLGEIQKARLVYDFDGDSKLKR